MWSLKNVEDHKNDLTIVAFLFSTTEYIPVCPDKRRFGTSGPWSTELGWLTQIKK